MLTNLVEININLLVVFSSTENPPLALLSKEGERVFGECCRDEKANSKVASASAVCIVKCTGRRMERRRGPKFSFEIMLDE